MEIGMIGLGRMGANMARRLMRGGHRCVVYDRAPAAISTLVGEGAEGADSAEDFLQRLSAPRAVWIMVPSGPITEATIMELKAKLSPGDTVIDGGNSYFKDTVRRGRELGSAGIHFVDVGTSGGIWGLDRGYCLMIGGPEEAVQRLDPIFQALAPGRGTIPATPGRAGTSVNGYLHCGPSGSGHFVKMIHNGIEYGLMQAYAEGFDLLRCAGTEAVPEAHRYQLPLGDIAELWRRGSVVGSWLLDLTALALAEDPALSGYTGHVEDSGEGRWTVQAAVEEGVSANVLTAALFARFRSRQSHSFGEQVLSAMRHKFGGHREPTP